MNQLYILRHGIAVPHGTPGVSDDERPLTPKGRKRIRQIGRGLRCLRIEVEKIISSPLPRAWETAQIVADVLGMSDRLEASEMLRDDRGAESIRDWVQSRDEPRLMIVGHNPALSDLPGLLVTGTSTSPLGTLKPGGIAALSHDGGRYTLDWLAPPRITRRVSEI